MVSRPSLLFTLTLASLPAACARQAKVEPVVASSASSPGYATRFPERVEGVVADAGRYEARVTALAGGFARYPDALKKPGWSDVLAVYRASDEAGRSAEYAERQAELEQVTEFFEEEREIIGQSVGGGVQWVAKDKGCTSFDASGQAKISLKKGVEERVEARTRESNPAHRLVAQRTQSLGKTNVEPLQRQVDELAESSHLAFVRMVQAKVELRRLIAEGEEVKATLDREQKEADAAAAAPKASDASTKRKEAAEAARAALGPALEKAKAALEGIEERIARLQKAHTDAVTALTADVQKRGGAA